MANRHYTIDEEFDIYVKVKVKLHKCSDSSYLNEIQLSEHVEDFKSTISEHLKNKLTKEYHRDEVTDFMDDWTYTIE